MRIADFTPFYRSTIGFDRMLNFLNHLPPPEPEGCFPPMDIERVGEGQYRMSMALAGYAREDLSITAEANRLVIEARSAEAEEGRKYLHRGVPRPAFKRTFDLADFVKVTDASYVDGILRVEFERETPEAMKPRRIDIESAASPERRQDRSPMQRPIVN